MKEHVQNIIKNSLLRLNEENELKRMTLSNILHINIDILIEQSTVWFNNEVPSDYKKVLHSLLTLATTLFDEKTDMSEIIYARDYKKHNLLPILNRVIKEFKSMFFINSINLNSGSECISILIDEKIFTDSIHHIFLSLFLFMNEKSSSSIEIREEASNVVIEIKYLNLSDSFPGVTKLQKVFFTYYEGTKYNVGVGLSTPLNTLKEMGAITAVKNFTSENNLCISISFPTIEFLKTIEDIRSSEIINKRKSRHGNILIIVKDIFLEIVLKEILHDVGYTTRKIEITDLENFALHDRYKCVIVDYGCIKDKFIRQSLFEAYALLFRKTIIIFNESEFELYSREFSEKFIILKKPVEIDEIINKIENS